jgi:hypothetical protein
VSNARCLPVAPRTRPNVILIISDDQGECHYGTAGECRSAQTGPPIPPASTPNLDVLAAYGTMFPIAHNTASWCFPSLNSMLTGRYQKSFNGSHDLSGDFLTVPQVLRSLEGEAGASRDPFLPESSIGGYCSLLAGKFTGMGGKVAFDAQARLGARRLGKLPCIAGGAGKPPLCGTERLQSYDPLTLFNIRDLFQFMDAMFYPVPGAPGTFTNQPFFVWYAPRIPHAPLRAPDVIDNYLFGTDRTGLGGFFQLGAMCRGAACPATVSAFGESNFGTERQYYSNVWWVDDNAREIRKYLAHKSAPHCVLPGGQSRLWASSPAQCGGGTWVTDLAPPVDTNTVLIYVDVTLPACASAADCKTGEICLGGHCEAVSLTGCNSSAQCAKGCREVSGRAAVHRRHDLRHRVLELQRAVCRAGDEVVSQRAQHRLLDRRGLPRVPRAARPQRSTVRTRVRDAAAEALSRSRSGRRRAGRSVPRSGRARPAYRRGRPAVRANVVARRPLRSRSATAELLYRRVVAGRRPRRNALQSQGRLPGRFHLQPVTGGERPSW